MKLGIALSGGGAKGVAHIGALQALREENIDISVISGTSSGSIVASLYCAGYSPYEILDIFNKHCREITSYDVKFPIKMISNMLNPKTPLTGLVNGDILENRLNMYFSYKNISNINDLKRKIAIPAVDLNSGKIIYFLNEKVDEESKIEYCYSENLAAIVRASSAFPGFFEPRRYKNYLLIDGGIKKNIPISILRKMGADRIIAINFIEENKKKIKDGSVISLVMKCFDIMGEEICKNELANADFLINPDVKNVSLLSCDNLLQVANAGYYAVKDNIDKIKNMLE